MIDRIDPIRGDIAELRHAMEKGFVDIEKRFADQRVELEHAVLIQTRWMLGGLAVLLTAILFKG